MASALAFFAYLILGFGPGTVFFGFFIAPKSFLVLLSLFSAFTWLTVLLITSAIFRGFVPIDETIQSYAGVLAASVFIQEAARYGVWFMHKKCLEALEGISRSSGHRFSYLDRLYMAVAWGFGHGACHSVFFFLSMLPLTTGSGTFYQDECPQMSLFLVGALYSIAFGMLLTSIMVLALDGYQMGRRSQVVLAPVIHFGASFMTLGNLTQDGCMWVMPTLLAMGFLSVVYVVQLLWRKGLQGRSSLDPRLQGPGGSSNQHGSGQLGSGRVPRASGLASSLAH